MRLSHRAPFLALLIATQTSLAAAEKLTAVRLPPATMKDLAAVSAPPPMARENRHHEKRPPVAAAISGPVIHEKATAQAAPEAVFSTPPIAIAFDSDTSRNLSPADASGAVSRSHVVGASNAAIHVQSRTGTSLLRLSLGQFWRSVSSVAEYYDPRVTYDEAADRWVIISIRNEMALMLAVSNNGDPTGAWTRYEIPVANCDFTRIALTRDTLLLNTWVDGYLGLVLSIPKAELYTGQSKLTITQMHHDADTVPVHGPDAAVEYVVLASNNGIYYQRFGENSMRNVFAGFSWEIPYEDRASQAGTTNRLDLGYGDIQSAVYQNGFIYAIHRIGRGDRSPDGNALLWWKLDVRGSADHRFGVIDSPSILAYPSLAVNRKGAMLITYCTLSPSTFPSAEYVYRDPAGQMSTPAVIRTGNSAIASTDRWGDYTTTVTDPNGSDFWAVQIYANAGNWQSHWIQVKVPPGKVRSVRPR